MHKICHVPTQNCLISMCTKGQPMACCSVYLGKLECHQGNISQQKHKTNKIISTGTLLIKTYRKP